MKRRLLIIATLLLAGAVVNVAVAWGCCVFSARGPMGSGNIKVHWDLVHPTTADLAWLDRKGWRPRPQDDHFVYQAASREITGHGLTRKAFFEYAKPRVRSSGVRTGLTPVFAIRNRAGWPLRSLYSEQWSTDPPGYQTYESKFAAATVPIKYQWHGSQQADARPLALWMIWPGFALNTVFWAVLLWLLICGPFVVPRLLRVRQALRVRRGLCPKCAYPMGESSVCTECGCGLPKRARAT